MASLPVPIQEYQPGEIRRERDDFLLRLIADDPAVRPFICYHDNDIDWTPALERASGVVILSNGSDAIGVFELTGENETGQEFQTHTMFGPTCRGKRALQAGRDMLAWMFSRNCSRIWGRTPVSNHRARMFNRLCGAVSIGFDEGSVEGPVEIFEVRP